MCIRDRPHPPQRGDRRHRRPDCRPDPSARLEARCLAAPTRRAATTRIELPADCRSWSLRESQSSPTTAARSSERIPRPCHGCRQPRVGLNSEPIRRRASDHSGSSDPKQLPASAMPNQIGLSPNECPPGCLLYTSMLGTYQGSYHADHLAEYLDEFTFRFNRRRSPDRGLLFYRLMTLAANADPLTYKQAVRNPTPKATTPTPPSGNRRAPRTLSIPKPAKPWRSTEPQA